MKKLLLFVLSAFLGFGSFAQQDQKAKSILENVTKTTRSFQSIQAAFDYIMDNKKEGIHEENKGEIIMKGEKYQLKLPQLGLEVYCDGKNVWSYMKDANEVSITSMEDESSEMMNPSKLFTIYEEGFNYRFVKETTAEGKSVYVIDLFPQTKEIEYSKITVQIDKQQMLIKSAEMTGKEGNNYTVRVNHIKTNVPADDRLFVFDPAKYPGVEEVDLR
ncbi:MAG: outer membrane lipoprotein carrier protein LolA [Prolixibacteraceae bacterium]